MTWPTQYERRLSAWVELRSRASLLPLDQSLLLINDWWFQCPWRPYYLHWDDRMTWPNAWELLSENIFCDLARALGIVYTVSMLEHPEITRIQLIQNEDSNLVLINDGKYILNWASGTLLNIASNAITIKRTLESVELNHLMG